MKVIIWLVNDQPSYVSCLHPYSKYSKYNKNAFSRKPTTHFVIEIQALKDLILQWSWPQNDIDLEMTLTFDDHINTMLVSNSPKILLY